MNKIIKYTQLIAAIMLAAALTACSAKISGTVSVKGNEPHTYPALTTEEGDLYMITGTAVDELIRDYQGARVHLKGKIVRKPDGPVPGIIEAEGIIESGEKP